jgi:hypothetical protein
MALLSPEKRAGLQRFGLAINAIPFLFAAIDHFFLKKYTLMTIYLVLVIMYIVSARYFYRVKQWLKPYMFLLNAAASLVAAISSLLSGKKYIVIVWFLITLTYLVLAFIHFYRARKQKEVKQQKG